MCKSCYGKCQWCQDRIHRTTALTFLTCGLWLVGPAQIDEAVTHCECPKTLRKKQRKKRK